METNISVDMVLKSNASFTPEIGVIISLYILGSFT